MTPVPAPEVSHATQSAVLALLLVACGGGSSQQAQVPTYPVTFVTEADPGVPLPGVHVVANGMDVGESSDLGIVQTTLRGDSGAEVAIEYTCPDGHRQPGEPEILRLQHFQGLEGSRHMQLRLRCPPMQRSAALVVRTNGKSGLPVYLDGTEVTRTNAQGFGVVVFRSEPDVAYQVRIGTDDNPNLRPQNPIQTFHLADRDDIFTFAQEFEEDDPSPRRRRRVRRPTRPSMSIMRIRRL